MKYRDLSRIDKLYFGYEEIGRALGIDASSARVSANRYVKQGLLVRVKRNVYVLAEKWRSLDREETFALANVIQVPSYISLMTALEYHGLTTLIQRDFVESVALKRTIEVKAVGVVFNYSKIDERLYGGFSKENGFFIASAEKALLDALYLMSIGRYRLDLSSIDLGKSDRKKLASLAKKYPEKTRELAGRLWKI